MKTIWILVLTMSWLVPAPETGCAALPSSVDGQRSHPRGRRSQPAGRSPLPGRARAPKANRPDRVPDGGRRSVFEESGNGGAAGPAQARGRGASLLPLRASGPVLNEGLHRAGLARPSTPVRSLPSPLHDVRHRGSNPAVIAGAISAARRSNGMLDGSGIKRKP